MAAINHVSINASDLAESVDFYVELLGAEPIVSPNFGIPVQWLALGETQLHLFLDPQPGGPRHHLGITVADLAGPYAVAQRRDALEGGAFGNHLILLPGDVVQLYLRDPAGNLVELDFAGADRLPEEMRARLVALADLHPQSDENLRGRLFVS
jgi:catechol 2,3-dioxygenase-like lactoylglutathione lyase family enzyme